MSMTTDSIMIRVTQLKCILSGLMKLKAYAQYAQNQAPNLITIWDNDDEFTLDMVKELTRSIDEKKD